MARQIFAVLLSLVLVTTGGAMTSARESVPAGTLMVICTGFGIATVVLDEDGAPTEARQVCPDCALGTLTGLPPVHFTLAAEPPASHFFVDAVHPALTRDFNGPVLPRGPPFA
jgi:hypothetical protein